MSPLFSVPIVTYNSANTIIDALESVRLQEYPNIELIISDDCSSDETVNICRNWIELNRDRFTRFEIIESPINKGISANQNRAIRACTGAFAQPLAGDDIMSPNCIRFGVDYFTMNPDVPIVFGQMEGFGRSQEEVDEYMNRCFDYSFFDMTAKEQYHQLVFKGNCVPAAASVYNLSLIKDLGLYNDERIPMVEDYPKWMSITKRGIQLRFIDNVLVRYRLSDNSISTTTTPSLQAKKSSALIYIYYKFKPRFKYYKSPIKKLGEVRKYIHAANTAWGGWFWKNAIAVDRCIAKVLNVFGAKLKV